MRIKSFIPAILLVTGCNWLAGCEMLDMIAPPVQEPPPSVAFGKVQVDGATPEELQAEIDAFAGEYVPKKITEDLGLTAKGWTQADAETWVRTNVKAMVEDPENGVILVVVDGASDAAFERAACDAALDAWIRPRWAAGPAGKYHLARPCTTYDISEDEATAGSDSPAEGAPEGATAEGAPAEGAEGAPAEGAPAEGAPAEGAATEAAPQ